MLQVIETDEGVYKCQAYNHGVGGNKGNGEFEVHVIVAGWLTFTAPFWAMLKQSCNIFPNYYPDINFQTPLKLRLGLRKRCGRASVRASY